MVDNSQINRAILIKKNKEISFSKGQSISTAFKTQLKNLSKSQIRYLEQSFGISRKTWNMIVAKKNEEYQNEIVISDFTEIPTLYHPNGINKKIKSTLLKQLISRDL